MRIISIAVDNGIIYGIDDRNLVYFYQKGLWYRLEEEAKV